MVAEWATGEVTIAIVVPLATLDACVAQSKTHTCIYGVCARTCSSSCGPTAQPIWLSRMTATQMAVSQPPVLITVRAWLDAFRTGPDHRLPAERDLAEKFAVTRSELRKALAVLEDEGLIRRHVGKGTFVVKERTTANASTEDLAAMTSPFAAMQARSVIEPELCRLAALHATTAQIALMRKLCEEMRRAPTWESYAELDWRFHNVIAEATGNVLLVEIQRLLNGVRRFVIWGSLLKRPVGPPPDYHSFAEHEEIVAAIAGRDGDRAMKGMLDHLGGTRSQLIDYRDAHGTRGTDLLRRGEA